MSSTSSTIHDRHAVAKFSKSRVWDEVPEGSTLIFGDTHTHPLNGHFFGTTRVSRCQKGKTNLDFTKARESEWQWHQLGHMQVCTSLQTDNHASTPPLKFLQAGCPSCRPTNRMKALRAGDTQISLKHSVGQVEGSPCQKPARFVQLF